MNPTQTTIENMEQALLVSVIYEILPDYKAGKKDIHNDI